MDIRTTAEFFAQGGIFTEVQAGFVVRYPREQARIEMEEHSFSHEDLRGMDRSHAARRGRAESCTEGGVLGGEPGRYQNIFRAIGRELVELGSYFVLLGEADRELLITYQMLDPHRNYLPVKRMAILGPEARGTMRDDARARMDQPRRGRAWGWL